MTKKEVKSTIVGSKKIGGQRELFNSCGKAVGIGALVVLAVIVLVICWNNKDKMSLKSGSKSKSKKSKNAKSNNDEGEDEEQNTSWDLKEEIKKLEMVQKKNFQKILSSTNDPLAEL